MKIKSVDTENKTCRYEKYLKTKKAKFGNNCGMCFSFIKVLTTDRIGIVLRKNVRYMKKKIRTYFLKKYERWSVPCIICGSVYIEFLVRAV